MQRGAGEVTGQCEGYRQVMNYGVMPGVAKYVLEGIVQHLGKFAYSLSYRDLDEKIDTTLMAVQ